MSEKNIKYFAMYGLEKFKECKSVEEAQKAIKEHSEFYKSKYTRKGTPKSQYQDQGLKRFSIVTNMGNMYYIY